MRVRVMCLLRECGLFIGRVYALMCSSSHAFYMCGLHDYAYVFIPKKCYLYGYDSKPSPHRAGGTGQRTERARPGQRTRPRMAGTTHQTHTDGITHRACHATCDAGVAGVVGVAGSLASADEEGATSTSAASLSSSNAMRTRL